MACVSGKSTQFGVGIEWAQKLEQEALARLDRFSCFEIIPENFFSRRFSANPLVRDRRKAFLKALRAQGTPTILHGVELSIGTDEPLKQAHLKEVFEVMDQVNAVLLTEHLCMTEAGGVEIGQLTPIPWTEKSCDAVCRKIEQVMRQVQIPFALENITNRFIVPGSELTEVEFINRVMKRTGCGLLLDLNNVHTNATNFRFDPFQWLEQIDLSNVSAIHLAGGIFDHEGDLLDSHNHAVSERVWSMYQWVYDRLGPITTVIERTDDVPPLVEVLAEVDRAEGILTSGLRGMNA